MSDDATMATSGLRGITEDTPGHTGDGVDGISGDRDDQHGAQENTAKGSDPHGQQPSEAPEGSLISPSGVTGTSDP